MNPPFELREASIADRPGLLALLAASFGDKIPVAIWDWLQEDTGEGRNRTFVAIDPRDGTVFASFSQLPVRVQVGTIVVPGFVANNVNVHPAYRGAGQLRKFPEFREESAFVTLGRYALHQVLPAGPAVGLGMPNPLSRPGVIKAGYREVGKLDFVARTDLRRRGKPCHVLPAFDAASDDLTDQVFKGISFGVRKSAAFLTWRLTSRPFEQYTILADETPTGRRGQLVWKQFTHPDGSRTAHIVDLLTLDDASAARLLEHAETLAAGAGFRSLDAWSMPGLVHAETFAAFGYLPQQRPRALVVHLHQIEEIPPGPWAFSLADNDVY